MFSIHTDDIYILLTCTDTFSIGYGVTDDISR